MPNMQAPVVDVPSADVAGGCAEAGKKAQEANDKIPAKAREKSYVVAGAKFVPAGGGSGSTAMGSSAVSSSMVLPGGKYEGFSKGIKQGQPSKVPCPKSPSGRHQYAESARPYEGHAEAKIIEDLFKDNKLQGTLYLKVHGKPICDACDKLIDCAEQSGVKVIRCP
jgi:hypothetical protein